VRFLGLKSDAQQPLFEGASLGIVLESRDAAGHRDDGFLDDILRGTFIQARAAGDIIEQPHPSVRFGFD
jgi:hypothetical protein